MNELQGHLSLLCVLCSGKDLFLFTFQMHVIQLGVVLVMDFLSQDFLPPFWLLFLPTLWSGTRSAGRNQVSDFSRIIYYTLSLPSY